MVGYEILLSGSTNGRDILMNNTLENKSCADLIAGELKDREQQLEQLYTAADDGDDSARDEIYQMAYGIDKREIYRVIWSGGGPADHLELTVSDGELLAVNYVYQDWYDGARLAVDESSPAYRYALEILEMMSQ
jgi:hypothetical protein